MAPAGQVGAHPPAMTPTPTETTAEAATPAAPSAESESLAAAFEEMQSLFPGRILEVVSPAADAATSGDDEPTPLDDELIDRDGYDDDDQDRLSFGASRDA